MLVDQEIVHDHDAKRTVHVYNKFDHSVAAEVARLTEAEGGGRGKTSEGCSYQLLGYIPPEMWNYDPWLVTARRALASGDRGEYTRMIQKFFEVHGSFKVHMRRKYWNGHSSKKPSAEEPPAVRGDDNG